MGEINNFKKKERERYTDSEIAIIRQYYDPLNSKVSCYQIHHKYLPHRTFCSIVTKASRIGLQRPLRQNKWQPEEIQLIKDNIGKVSVLHIYEELKKLWIRKQWQFRSEPYVRRKVALFCNSKYGVDSNYMSVSQVADAMNCSKALILEWCRYYKNILKPEKPAGDRSTVFINIKNFRRFMQEYPGEIAKCRPDILWLLSVAFEQDHW